MFHGKRSFENILLSFLAINFSLISFEIDKPSNAQGTPMTPAQESELKLIREQSLQKQQELQKQTGPTFYADPKVPKTNARQAVTTDIFRSGVFYVTLEGSSFLSVLGLNGHGAMVLSRTQTVEAWGNQSATRNGVQVWPNDWNTGAFAHFLARTALTTTSTQDAQAANRAKAQVGKPYNKDLFSIDQDNSYYCSQLVYRQFKVLFNADLNVGGGAVPPVDLANTQNAVTIYSK